MITRHEEFVQILFEKVCAILAHPELKLRFIKRQGNPAKRGATRFVKGYINLKTKVIGLDIYTPKRLKPKSANGLIRTICHEVAHLQKPPFRQRWRGHLIFRQHFPVFYRQVTRNINKMKKDAVLRHYFQQ
jgi:hypothetical protein